MLVWLWLSCAICSGCSAVLVWFGSFFFLMGFGGWHGGGYYGCGG